jgi:hypothetical protein
MVQAARMSCKSKKNMSSLNAETDIERLIHIMLLRCRWNVFSILQEQLGVDADTGHSVWARLLNLNFFISFLVKSVPNASLQSQSQQTTKFDLEKTAVVAVTESHPNISLLHNAVIQQVY